MISLRVAAATKVTRRGQAATAPPPRAYVRSSNSKTSYRLLDRRPRERTYFCSSAALEAPIPPSMADPFPAGQDKAKPSTPMDDITGTCQRKPLSETKERERKAVPTAAGKQHHDGSLHAQYRIACTQAADTVTNPLCLQLRRLLRLGHVCVCCQLAVCSRSSPACQAPMGTALRRLWLPEWASTPACKQGRDEHQQPNA